MKPAVVILSKSALPVARKVAAAVDGEIHGARARAEGVAVPFESASAHIAALFKAGRPIVGLMASGALIRLLAPHLSDKHAEPPVLAVSEDGQSVVPLLGGHHGANALAQTIAEALGAHAAITTAGDLRFGVALDAPPEGYVLLNPQAAKPVMADLVAGETARLKGSAAWIEQSGIPLDENGPVTLTVTDQVQQPGDKELVYAPGTLCLGMGCERGTEPEEAVALAASALREAGLAPQAVAGVFSIDLKADEAAIHAVADHFGVPALFFDAAMLEAEAGRLENPSDVVFAEVGCHGVAEGAALAAAGQSGQLVVAKRKSRRATCAVARATEPVEVSSTGRARGTLFIVGIGPGSEAWRSPEVTDLVARSTDLVGYSLYLDLLGALAEGKARHDFDLGKEEARVRHAMELAGEGRTVCLVCSGDAGIYAMATLAFELLDKGGADGDAPGLSDAARRINIAVSPGISALQAAAARAGAPLGHDFCTISLSDLLTPWPDIQRRVKAASEGDFVIAFYNPVSKRRRTQLAHARDVLLEHRPPDTPVILATNLGREGETVRIVPLGELRVDDVDMLTVVIVGSSQSRTVKTGDGRTWVYTPRGYAAKEGSVMGDKEAAE
ncbi:precorrin-3B C(17)-methyltransferase [Hoeflea poritis]|uniref:Precorrin-3B C(17)-methyltransferase n=1 Tax=Hoeflea poritis TaxID=2993659 RepID=A0ABT4VKI3_9HYPH|nr:precorrin-3B C(17)-methyltransferase [Hoeflea poritis]MDA4844665.1 precorrin-3B C(17)-methyltransferase [Hoeflea poritis]